MDKTIGVCPFCGKNDIRTSRAWEGLVFWQACKQCGANGPIAICDDASDDENASKNQWNRRLAPQWSTEPPTESGWYVSCWPGSKSPRIDKISIFGDEIRIGDFSLTEICYLDEVDEKKIKWLKIEPPEVTQ